MARSAKGQSRQAARIAALARDKSVALVESGNMSMFSASAPSAWNGWTGFRKTAEPAAEEQSGTEFAESFRKILGGQMNKLYGKRWAFENSHEAK